MTAGSMVGIMPESAHSALAASGLVVHAAVSENARPVLQRPCPRQFYPLAHSSSMTSLARTSVSSQQVGHNTRQRSRPRFIRREAEDSFQNFSTTSYAPASTFAHPTPRPLDTPTVSHGITDVDAGSLAHRDDVEGINVTQTTDVSLNVVPELLLGIATGAPLPLAKNFINEQCMGMDETRAHAISDTVPHQPGVAHPQLQPRRYPRAPRSALSKRHGAVQHRAHSVGPAELKGLLRRQPVGGFLGNSESTFGTQSFRCPVITHMYVLPGYTSAGESRRSSFGTGNSPMSTVMGGLAPLSPLRSNLYDSYAYNFPQLTHIHEESLTLHSLYDAVLDFHQQMPVWRAIDDDDATTDDGLRGTSSPTSDLLNECASADIIASSSSLEENGDGENVLHRKVTFPEVLASNTNSSACEEPSRQLEYHRIDNGDQKSGLSNSASLAQVDKLSIRLRSTSRTSTTNREGGKTALANIQAQPQVTNKTIDDCISDNKPLLCHRGVYDQVYTEIFGDVSPLTHGGATPTQNFLPQLTLTAYDKLLLENSESDSELEDDLDADCAGSDSFGSFVVDFIKAGLVRLTFTTVGTKSEQPPHSEVLNNSSKGCQIQASTAHQRCRSATMLRKLSRSLPIRAWRRAGSLFRDDRDSRSQAVERLLYTVFASVHIVLVVAFWTWAAVYMLRNAAAMAQ